ncbi:hypothetical protein LZ31DRAFT_547905 [Colletotrichum somersetense]|nr:hypothetical protein LZ31DRAFT_547905 [Colletotrichum somersetense]
MEHTVRSFKSLSRKRTTPTGLPNHWVFGLRHVPIDPEGDLVVVVHPLSRYLLSAGPAQILSLPGASDKAKALVPLLLDAFLKGNSSSGALSTSETFFAPWSWEVDDPELASAISQELKQLGIEGVLGHVEACSAGDRAILDESWHALLERLRGMTQGASKQHTGPKAATATASPAVELGDRSKCHGCGSNRESFAAPLKMCSACGQAWYHSQDCQRQHWKQHKKACLANRSGANASPASTSGAKPSLEEPYTYYNQIARKSPDAQKLLRALRLDPASPEGTAKPLRRLVITGQDSPENMKLLFGPSSLVNMKEEHENARIEVLLDPPRGSPSYNLSKFMDDPSLTRSVRPPTEAEKQKLQEVREMQQRIRQKVGAGNTPSSGDMKSILSSFGPDWPEKLPLYMSAANTMDQGVHR